jgi:hypothetical protein
VKQLIAGIKGSKPGSGPPKPDGHLSKAESRALDAEYRRQRNQALQLKNHRETMLLAKARGELIERRVVQLQASFLLTAMRRQALALPQAYCDRLAAAGDPLEVKAILDEAMRGLLAEVADLPNRIDAAAWERFLADGAPPETEETAPKAKRAVEGHDSPE